MRVEMRLVGKMRERCCVGVAVSAMCRDVGYPMLSAHMLVHHQCNIEAVPHVRKTKIHIEEL